MTIFYPKKGFKPLIINLKFLTLILIPTFAILISTRTGLVEWSIFLSFSYGFVALIYFIVQQTTLYWIDKDIFYYKSLFLKGSIAIKDIRKIEVDATCWLANKPATTHKGGIFIYFAKFDDVFITPDHNDEVVAALLLINPTVEVIYAK